MSELRRRAVVLTVIILLTTVIAGLHAVQGSAISGSYTQPIMKGQRVSGDESAGKMSPEQFERHDRAAVFFMKGMVGVIIFLVGRAAISRLLP